MAPASVDPFPMEEAALADVLAGLPPVTAAVSDPPWRALAGSLPAPARLILAGDLDLAHLERLAAAPDRGEAVVGIGGGAALDTAKFLALRSGRRLIQAPSIVSVDAAFTDSAGVRVDGKVRYRGKVRPERVVLDLDLIRAAPARLNRAGAGDILSCHTALFDWRLASSRGQGAVWDEGLADLGRALLTELEAAAADVRAVSAEGVRFLAGALRRVGAACAAAGHSRFEEGSEHFLAYALEHRTGRRFIHGEIVAMATAAMSTAQGNDPGRVRRIIEATGVRAHPDDLGLARSEVEDAVAALPAYVRAEGLDVSCIDLAPPSPAEAWQAIAALPREGR